MALPHDPFRQTVEAILPACMKLGLGIQHSLKAFSFSSLIILQFSVYLKGYSRFMALLWMASLKKCMMGYYYNQKQNLNRDLF